MLENKVIITNESNKNKIYEKSKNNWVIELDGSKINNWDDFYDIMQKEIDVADYNSKFGKGYYTYQDFARDIALLNKVEEKKYEGINIILDYTDKFKIIEGKEKADIYENIVITMLLEWYRDLRIINKNKNITIDIKFYILIDDSNFINKNFNFTNELIIAIENDKKEIYKRYKDFELQKIDVKSKKDPDSYIEFKKNEINDKFLNQIEKKLSNFGGSKLGILLFNSEELIWYRKYKLLYIIENILIKRYIRGQEIHIYLIFNNDIF